VLEHLASDMSVYRGVTSVLVASGLQEFEWYDAPHGERELRNTRSATKTATGMLVGAAIDRGLIRDVRDEIADYLGKRSSSDPMLPIGVTIDELLTMSSCLDCNDDDPTSPGNEELMYSTADWLAFARSIPLGRARESRTFRYCTAHTVLLGAAVEAASGAELSEFADEVLFTPLGITNAKWFRSETGLAFPGGGLELRSRDLRALGELYLRGGAWAGQQVVSKEWVERSTRAHARVDDTTSYGYLWWLRSYPSPRGELELWLMLGNGGNKVVVFPQLGAVVVITATNFGKPGMHQLTDGLLRDRILPELLDAT
jgi:CubicO group peptidase (beta-lactamase class C family)